MAGPALAIPAIMGILRFAASKGAKEAITKYGRSMYNEAVAAASKADKMGGQIRTQLNRLGKEMKAGLPAKIRNSLPSVTSQASRSPAIRGGRSRAVQKKTVEGEYIPKSQKSGTPSTESRRGNTYQGSTGGGGGKEPPIYANRSDRFGGGRGQGPQGRMPKRAVGAGVLAGAAATSVGDGEAKKTTGSSYTIKKGDTLSAIAKNSGVRLSELRDANPQVKDLNKIMPGQKIKLPGQTIKGSGKSIYEGMTKAEMEKMAMKQKARAGRGGRDVSAKTEADVLAMLRQEKLRRQNKETTAKKAKGGMAKKSYAKGGYVNCGASMKPTQKSSRGVK